MKFVIFQPNVVIEQKGLKDGATESLSGAAILIPEGSGVTEQAMETIRHFRYYLEGQDGEVLFSDRVVALVDVGNVDEMIEHARREASEVVSCAPDFKPYDMDDECGLLRMSNAKVYAFRNNCLSPKSCGSLGPALEARGECLAACEDQRIVAVVYNDVADFEKHNS